MAEVAWFHNQAGFFVQSPKSPLCSLGWHQGEWLGEHKSPFEARKKGSISWVALLCGVEGNSEMPSSTKYMRGPKLTSKKNKRLLATAATFLSTTSNQLSVMVVCLLFIASQRKEGDEHSSSKKVGQKYSTLGEILRSKGEIILRKLRAAAATLHDKQNWLWEVKTHDLRSMLLLNNKTTGHY